MKLLTNIFQHFKQMNRLQGNLLTKDQFEAALKKFHLNISSQVSKTNLCFTVSKYSLYPSISLELCCKHRKNCGLIHIHCLNMCKLLRTVNHQQRSVLIFHSCFATFYSRILILYGRRLIELRMTNSMLANLCGYFLGRWMKIESDGFSKLFP